MNILSCTLCGNCFVCPYLEKYGYPKEIFLKRDSSVFICTNCGLCSKICPFSAEPSESLYSLKIELIKEKKLSENTNKALESSRQFVKRMSSFPFSHFDLNEVIFFPGCAMTGMGKGLILKIKEWLEKRLNCKIGVVLTCCGDPAYQNGDIDFVTDFINALKDKLENIGINKIIFGCSNCKKIFDNFLPDFENIHLTELIREEDLKNIKDSNLIHHPCPNFKKTEIKEKIDEILRKRVDIVFDKPFCCGLGGSANKLDKDVSLKFLKRIEENANGRKIITSCMGCRNRFLKNNIESTHIYEYLTDTFLKKPVDDWKKWFNRLTVSFFSKINIKKILIFLIILFGVFYVYDLQKSGNINLQQVLEIVRSHKYLSPLIYLVLYTIGPSFFFPSLLLTIIAGMLWGPVWGVLLAITGATLGCSVPFLLSRYLFYNFVKKTYGIKRWEKLKKLVLEKGWKIVAFTRIVPIFPFPVLNYLYGITPIPFLHYVLSSFVFMLPACIAYVYLGSSLFDLIVKGNIWKFIVSIILISTLIFIPILFKRKNLNK